MRQFHISFSDVLLLVSFVANSVTMANNSVTLDPNDASLFPGIVPFVCGLQDEGKQDKKKPHVIKYGPLDKLAKDIVDRLAKHQPPGMPSNVTRRKIDVTKFLVSMRKHVDKTNARLEFVSIVNDPKNKIASSDPEKMFVVTNDTSNAGFNVVMAALLAAWRQRLVGTNSLRVPNDALRVAIIMLDGDIRGSIHGLPRVIFSWPQMQVGKSLAISLTSPAFLKME